MELQVQRRGAVRVIRIAGEVDLYHSHRLKDTITELVSDEQSPIVMDFEETTYLDSSAVGVLIYATSVCSKKRVPLRIANVHGGPLRVLELTKLTSYLPLTESCESALSELSGDAEG